MSGIGDLRAISAARWVGPTRHPDRTRDPNSPIVVPPHPASESRKPDGMYTLYYSPGTASMCVHQALIEANAQYRLVLVDLQAGQQRDPAYLRLNPGGVVPTLLIDDVPFTESAALLMTVATRHPEARLAPGESSASRAAWYQWIAYLANTLQPAFRLWFYPADVSDAPDTQAIVNAATRRKIESVWARIDAHLLAQGPYLLGAEFSAADLMLIMLMRWSRNMPRPATEWPALHQYAAQMRARPTWKKLYALEGLSDWR
ncbi:MAG TPA: glutathione S-transferase family protein [Steroidobacteraceae bacterium]|nr:glutathione S-transferase family protein [Steroidobacteraceae bacterium]